jgi:hypothetical protein
MKIFLSWSGPYSQAVAAALKEWLPYIFSDVEPFLSTEDIRKGKRWRATIAKQLSLSNFGIICLAPGNLEAPWLLYEAGALSKLKSSQACTLLLGSLRPGDIEGPLSDFQATVFNKPDMLKLVQSINTALGRGKLDDTRLKTIFDKWWEELEKQVIEGAHAAKSSAPEKRKPDDLLYEILELCRSTAKQVATLNTDGDDKQKAKLVELLSYPIDHTALDRETVKRLAEAGIATIGELSTHTEPELVNRVHLTRKAVCDIKTELASLGLELGLMYDKELFERVLASKNR